MLALPWAVTVWWLDCTGELVVRLAHHGDVVRSCLNTGGRIPPQKWFQQRPARGLGASVLSAVFIRILGLGMWGSSEQLGLESFFVADKHEKAPWKPQDRYLPLADGRSVFDAFLVFCAHGNQGHTFLGKFDCEFITRLKVKQPV